jgi:hypothetical protein
MYVCILCMYVSMSRIVIGCVVRMYIPVRLYHLLNQVAVLWLYNERERERAVLSQMMCSVFES